MIQGSALLGATMLLNICQQIYPRRKVGKLDDGRLLYGARYYGLIDKFCFIYGNYIYNTADLPLRTNIDLDLIPIKHLCSVLDWVKVSLNDNKIDTEENKKAYLITNAEECPDVKWNKK